jgi:3-oxoacyl-[acyl-carrier protein] reductase
MELTLQKNIVMIGLLKMELTFQKCSLGIRRAISLKLASVGTDVVILYAGNQVKAEETVSQISQLGRKSLALQVDVSDADQVNQAFQEVMKLFGKIDVLINNAGITKDNLVMRMNK